MRHLNLGLRRRPRCLTSSLTCSELPIGWVGRGGFKPALASARCAHRSVGVRIGRAGGVEVGEGVGEGIGGCGMGVPLVAVGQAARGKNFWTRGCDLGDVDAALTVDGDAADGGELADVVAKNAPVRQVVAHAVEDLHAVAAVAGQDHARWIDGQIDPAAELGGTGAAARSGRGSGRRRRSAGCAATRWRRR